MQVVDLTHTIHPNIPIWPGSCFFFKELQQAYSSETFRVFNYHFAAGTGTHIDAPFHSEEQGKTISDFNLPELIGPCCVIDVCQQVQQDPDYMVSITDVTLWEHTHGIILEGSIVLAHTGWSQHWEQPQKYVNQDVNGILHFPGFSPEAAALLIKRGILGVGIDTLSIDAGNSKTFPAHHIFLKEGIFIIENIANTRFLPPKGATIFAMPLKIAEAAEAPARVFALLKEM